MSHFVHQSRPVLQGSHRAILGGRPENDRMTEPHAHRRGDLGMNQDTYAATNTKSAPNEFRLGSDFAGSRRDTFRDEPSDSSDRPGQANEEQACPRQPDRQRDLHPAVPERPNLKRPSTCRHCLGTIGAGQVCCDAPRSAGSMGRPPCRRPCSRTRNGTAAADRLDENRSDR